MCPNCRQVIDYSTISKDLIADSIINELGVSCNYPSCPWKGVLNNLNDHLKTCWFNPDKMGQKMSELFKKESNNLPYNNHDNNYVDFNPNASLKARLYQKNPNLIKNTTLEDSNKKTPEDIFELFDTDFVDNKKALNFEEENKENKNTSIILLIKFFR